MIKLRSRRLCKRSPKLGRGSGGGGGGGGGDGGAGGDVGGGDIKWELRPGGMLVQKRGNGSSVGEEMIKLRVSTVLSHRCHDISIEPTSTFGELKVVLSMVSGLEPREQRLLYRGKEREDTDYLHMVGVGDMDKLLLLEDPAIKDSKIKLHAQQQLMVVMGIKT